MRFVEITKILNKNAIVFGIMVIFS